MCNWWKIPDSYVIRVRLKWRSTLQKHIILDPITSNPRWDPLSSPGLQQSVTSISPELGHLSGPSASKVNRMSGRVNLLESQLLSIEELRCIVFILNSKKEILIISHPLPSTHLPIYVFGYTYLPSQVWILSPMLQVPLHDHTITRSSQFFSSLLF